MTDSWIIKPAFSVAGHWVLINTVVKSQVLAWLQTPSCYPFPSRLLSHLFSSDHSVTHMNHMAQENPKLPQTCQSPLPFSVIPNLQGIHIHTTLSEVLGMWEAGMRAVTSVGRENKKKLSTSGPKGAGKGLCNLTERASGPLPSNHPILY